MKKNISRIYIYGFLLITAILFCWWYIVTPFYSDDLVFAVAQEDWLGGSPWKEHLGNMGNGHFSWAIDRLIWICQNDSPRFWNLWISFLLWFPKPVVDILTTIFFISSVYIIARTFGWIQKGQFNRVCAYTLTLLLFLPWEVDMTCVIFTENYVWPLLPVSIFIWAFNTKRNLQPIWLVIIGLFTGWMHEMIGCALFGGCLIVALIFPKLRLKALLMGCGALCPALNIYISEIINRQQGENAIVLFFSWHGRLRDWIYMQVIYYFWFLVVLGIAIICFLKGRWRSKIDPMWVLLFVAAIAVWCQSEVVSRYYPRSTWYCVFFSILLFFHWINLFWTKPVIKYNPVVIYIGLLSVTALNISAGAIETRKMAKMEKTIQATYFKNPYQYSYVDMDAVKRPTMLAYNRLSYYNQAVHTEFWPWKTTCSWWGKNFRLMMRPVPRDLKDFSLEKATKIAGENPFYHYNGWIVMPCDYVGDKTWKLHFECNRRCYKYVIAAPFTTEKDEMWLFVTFYPSDFLTRWFNITRIER